MDFRHVRAFVTVAEEQNFTRAAQRLHMTQPPLTRQIHQLERELGVPLFIRGRTGAAMTPKGQALLEPARVVLRALEDFERCTHTVTVEQSRAVSVGIVWGLWTALNVIREVHATRFPDVTIAARDLHQAAGSRLPDHVDVALMRPPIDPRLEAEPLFEEHFVALLGSRHPLAARPSIALSELAGESLLLFDRAIAPLIYDKIRALSLTAAPASIRIENQPAPYEAGAMMLVASGQGYYIHAASRFTQSHRTSGVAVVPLDAPEARTPVLLVWRRDDRSLRLRHFIESARAAFRASHAPNRLQSRSA